MGKQGVCYQIKRLAGWAVWVWWIRSVWGIRAILGASVILAIFFCFLAHFMGPLAGFSRVVDAALTVFIVPGGNRRFVAICAFLCRD